MAYNPRSPEAAVYQKWYKTRSWQKRRAHHLAKEPWCRMCLLAGRRTQATTADHIDPHRGDLKKFWDVNNLQSLCDIHHGEKQRMECGGQQKQVIGKDGWPVTGQRLRE